jgi:hypothetical protein
VPRDLGITDIALHLLLHIRVIKRPLVSLARVADDRNGQKADSARREHGGNAVRQEETSVQTVDLSIITYTLASSTVSPLGVPGSVAANSARTAAVSCSRRRSSGGVSASSQWTVSR